MKDVDALSHTAGTFRDIRDGRIPPPPTFGFRVLKAFTSPILKSKFLPGMQGRVLKCEDDGAYVEVRDLFDVDGKPLKDWIHRKAIEIGTKPYGTWQVDTRLIPRTASKLTPKELALLNKEDSKHLALAISTFLQTLAKTRPNCLTSEDLKRLGGEGGTRIPWMTTVIVEGVKKAGLLPTLNNPQFTIQELAHNAIFDCASHQNRNDAGFYFRRYIMPSPNQPKKGCILYTGQSGDLETRHRSYSLPSSKQHAEWIANSDSVDMRALCLAPKVFYFEHRFIVEQLFTSLLQTYRKVLFEKMSGAVVDTQLSYHNCNFQEMELIANEAAKLSGWTGAVRRKSFWSDYFVSCEGANYQSPISEAGMHESSQWLRTDGSMPGKSGEAIPISNFIRAAPKRATLSKDTNGKLLVIHSIARPGVEDKAGYSFRITRTALNDSVFDDIAWPAEGTFYNVKFEVRLDWKPHPYSWARLPLYGPFEDWDRANSWALCIEWTDKTGQHRSRYLHCERPFIVIDDLSNGSMQGYARGIEMIHWLFKEQIPATDQHSWLQQPPVMGNNLKVVKHNHVTQMITVEESQRVATTAPISSKRKHEDVIKKEMQGFGPNGDAKLAYVGHSLAEVRKLIYPAKWGLRVRCDTCLFRGAQHSCIWDDGKKVCKCCLQIFGRPFCSWTSGIPSPWQSGRNAPGNDFHDLEAKGNTTDILRRKALLSLPGWPGTDTMSAEPIVMDVDTGEDEDEGPTELTAAEAAMEAENDGDWMGP